MGQESALIFKGNQENLKLKLKKYIYSEDKTYNELTLKYLDKWIWVYIYYNNKYNIYLDLNFSKDFSAFEIEKFIQEMISIGFMDSNEDEEEGLYKELDGV